MFSSLASRRSVEAPNPNSIAASSANNILTALRNRIATNNQAALAPPNAGSNIIVALARLTAKVTGIFQVSFNVAYTTPAALVAADTYVWTVTQQRGAGAFTYTTPANMTVLSTGGGIGSIDLIATGAGTAIATGGGGSAAEYVGTYKSDVAATATGQTTFNWSNSNNDLPLVVGQNAIFILSLNASAHGPASIDNVSISMMELP